MLFLLPALNEESGLRIMIPRIKKSFPNAKILVVDGNSTDRTVSVAKRMGCEVFVQTGKGKGNAVIEALERIDNNETVVMMDADGTYELGALKTMLKEFGENSIVIGSRFALRDKDSFTLLNLIGNKLLCLAASVLFLRRVGDLLSGFRVFKCKVVKNLQLKAQNFEIETEMSLKAVKNGINLINIPCQYHKRHGETKLRPFRDGILILKRILKERLTRD